MSEPPISVSGQRAEHATFAQRLRAEWTRFRASRGSVLGIVASALAVWLLGGLSLAADVRTCSSGGVEVACESAPVGPSGEAVSDRFYFVHQTLTGDGSITARLTAMTGLIKEPPPPGTIGAGPEPVVALVPWAKAGLMIKDGVGEGAAYGGVMLTAEHGVRMQYNFTNDVAGLPGGASMDSPRWLRLTREGDKLTGYESSDGRQWVMVGSAQVQLPATIQIGMFVASPADLTTSSGGSSARFSEATAVFDQVSLPGLWIRDDVGLTLGPDGTPHHPGSVIETDGRFTITGVGDVGPASGDAGVKVESTLVGTFAGMIGVIVVALLFGTVGPRNGGASPSGLAGVHTSRALAAKALLVAAVAFVAGLIAAAGAMLIGLQVLAARSYPIHTVPWLTEVRVVVGTAALLAAAGVLATALGVLIRRTGLAVITAVALMVLPNLLAATIPVLPLPLSIWLLRVTPAAGFAIQQSVPAYSHAVYSNLPLDGFYPLAPGAGLAVAWGFAVATLVWACARLRRKETESRRPGNSARAEHAGLGHQRD